jgi:dienelactone hydrolase
MKEHNDHFQKDELIMNKRFTSILLALLLLVSMVSLSAFAEQAPAASSEVRYGAIEGPAGPKPEAIAGFYQVSDVGDIVGSHFYLYAAENRIADLTPILYVFGDKPYVDEDAAKAAMEALGLIEIADAEGGAVILVNPVGETWSKADIDVFEAIEAYIFGEDGKVNLTSSYNLQFAIGEGSGATFINNYLSGDSKRIAGVLTFGGEIGTPVALYALPAYLVSASQEAVDFYLACNDNTGIIPASGRVAGVIAQRKTFWETQEAEDSTIYIYAPSPIRKVIVSKAEATSLDKAIIADAWGTLFRWTTRSDVVTAAARFTGVYYNDSEFTLQPRPNFEAAGFEITSFEGASVKEGLPSTVPVYLPKAAQEAMAGSSDQKFPMIIVMPPSNERLEVEGQGWGQLAIDHDIILVTGHVRQPELTSALLDYLLATYPVDESRVYIVGFSGGSHGVMYSSEGIPERFAAVAIMDVFDGPHYPNLLAAAPDYDYDIDLPIAIIANGMGTESTNFDKHYAWFDAAQQIFAINEIEPYEGELDYAKYPFWGFPVSDETKIEPPSGLAIWQGFSYDADGIPLVSEIHTDVTEHARYVEYANVIWDFFAPLSRDLTTHAVVYTPAE